MRKLIVLIAILFSLSAQAQLTTDKVKHIACSTTLQLVSLNFFKNDYLLATTVTLSIGIGKELIYDKMLGKGCCDAKDMLANCVGIAIGTVINKLINKQHKTKKYERLY